MTIIELMVVVVILMILVATMMPSLVRVQVLGRTSQTKAIIHTLSNACDMYMREFNEYPDSTKITSPPADAMQGRHRLVRAFYGQTGEADDSVDGRQGDGWRLKKRGQVYDAAFFGVQDVTRAGEDPKIAFIDSFGNEIYYYRKHSGGYEDGDNANGPDINSYGPTITNNMGFLLISKGYDGKWETDTGAKKDDITNFK